MDYRRVRKLDEVRNKVKLGHIGLLEGKELGSVRNVGKLGHFETREGLKVRKELS